MTWETVLPPAVRDRATARIEVIAREVSRARNAPRFPDRALTGDDFDRALASLSWGLPGRALFFLYAAFHFQSQELLDIAASLLSEAASIVARLSLSPSLYSGTLGLGWITRHASRRFNSTKGDPAEAIEHRLGAALFLFEKDQIFELTRGLVGCGLFLLENPHHQDATRNLVVEILNQLEQWAEWHVDGVTWLRAPELLAERRGVEFAGGAYDLGIPHGVSGVLAFLAMCAERNIDLQRVRRLAVNLGRWIVAQRLPPNARSVFPEGIDRQGKKYPSRLSWCYGDLGIALALLRAGITFQIDYFREIALTTALAAASRSAEDSAVIDGGLCHGYGGVAHMFNRLYQTTGDQRLRDAAVHWYDALLSSPESADGIAGFATCWRSNGRMYALRDPGFLTGAAGIGLALIAATSTMQPSWDRILLADVSLPL